MNHSQIFPNRAVLSGWSGSGEKSVVTMLTLVIQIALYGLYVTLKGH